MEKMSGVVRVIRGKHGYWKYCCELLGCRWRGESQYIYDTENNAINAGVQRLQEQEDYYNKIKERPFAIDRRSEIMISF